MTDVMALQQQLVNLFGPVAVALSAPAPVSDSD